jgi:hypothetical protein
MPDRALNDEVFRLAQLDQAMIWVRQNAAALGLGANVVSQSLRDERDQILAKLRSQGETLMDENIAVAAKRRATA